MNWLDIIEKLGLFTVGTVSITGIVIYFSKKIFENQVDILKSKHLYRYSKLYTDKLEIIRELYKRLVKAEKAIEILMRPIRWGGDKSTEDLEREAVEYINSLFDFYDENEIIFDEETIDLITQLQKNFYEVWNKHSAAKMMESARGTEVWSDAIQASIDAYNTIIEKEIPQLKNALKKDFQNRYKILQL